MERWEYKVLSLSDGTYTDTLNAYGREGWELVAVAPDVHELPAARERCRCPGSLEHDDGHDEAPDGEQEESRRDQQDRLTGRRRRAAPAHGDEIGAHRILRRCPRVADDP